MAYALSGLVGLVLALLARRLDRDPPGPHRAALLAIAAIGALSGALLFELPADAFGWTTGTDGAPIPPGVVGGRTVLGGLLGGWLAVEAGKRGLDVRAPTGDGFALPLAVALACGRVGCWLAGCCAGRAVRAGDAWAAWALPDAHGTLRFPAQLAEVAFHATCAVAILVAMRAGALRHRRFAMYVGAYAALRFALEWTRANPPIALGLTYYQFLTLPLLALATATVIVRTPERAARASTAA